jgi:hypothetical protein
MDHVLAIGAQDLHRVSLRYGAAVEEIVYISRS